MHKLKVVRKIGGGKYRHDLFTFHAMAAIDNNNDGLIYTSKLHNPNRLTTLLIFH